MADPIEISLRDLAYRMMSVSDNAATDILVNLLGTESINATLRELGLTRTRVDGTCDDLYRMMEEDVPGGEDDPETLRAARAVDKTGTLPLVRNEVGVVEFPDGGRYAVGVFTRTDDPAPNAPRLDALIGWAAAEAVAQLRGERP